MNYMLQSYARSVAAVCAVLLVAILALPRSVAAECQELKIVEYEDRVEAVCVGEPLTA